MIALQTFQSALHAGGPEAARIARLWWLFFWISTIVFVLVLVIATLAVVRGRRRARSAEVETQPSEARLTYAVGAAVGVTVVILLVLLVSSIWTGRLLASIGTSSAVTIDITGHQWWWELDYREADASRHVKGANEIHIPVGRPVVLKVTSHDVIHSFWAPNLQGKRDLIPGYTTAIWIQADQPGVFRGQCAEFCGRQHAHMAFEIVAESGARFDSWRDAQLLPAHEPANDAERRGLEVFRNAQCALCHTVRGSGANGLVGPDLTHLASRRTIAAATLPNSRGHLAGWIVDSQHIKPGNQMPPNPIGADDLQALLTYLESLK